MEVLDKDKHGKQIAEYANRGLLCIHIALLLMFLTFKAYIMVGVNVLSIAAYIYAMKVLEEDRVREYLYLVYCEVSMHMMLAVIMMGWSWGFQLHYFVLAPISFLCEYSAQSKKAKTRPIMVSLATAILFLSLRSYTQHFEPVYQVEYYQTIHLIYCVNTFIAFGFLIVYMDYYTKFIGRLENKLRSIAEYDELTGLYNRNYMKYILETIVKVDEESQTEMTVAILDVDNFKRINDTYGHIAGDYVLSKIGEILKPEGEEIFVARWGGEEFMVVQTQYEHISQCYQRLNNWRKQIEKEKFIYNSQQIPVTITAGIAEFKQGDNVEEIIQLADERLYIGKGCGKNCVV